MAEGPEISRERLLDALRRTGGSRAQAAELLGVARATVYRLIDRHGLRADVLRTVAQRYEVVARLGRGAASDVFRVRDRLRDGADRALKLLSAQPCDPAAQERLRLEFRRLAMLRHPGLVRVHDFGVDDDTRQPFIVMDLVPGRPFAEAAQGRPVPWVLEAAAAALAALEHLHRNGLVHRDLKSENVLVEADAADRPQVVVMDLELSDVLAGPGLPPGGSLLYLAPEVLAGGRATPRSDLYSFGVLLYLALTARFPFQGATAADTIEAQRRGEPDAPSAARAEIAPELDRVVLRLLATDPAARYPDAASVLEDLAPFVAGGARPAPRFDSGLELVGRSAELDRLLELATPAERTSRRPPLVVLLGEPGIGKTRLLEAALDELRSRGVRVARGTCRAAEVGAMTPVAEVLAEALRGCDGTGQRAEDRIARSHAPALAFVAPRLAAGATAGAEPNRTQLLDSLATLLVEIAEHHQLVIAFDDLQYADAFVHDLVWLLARRARRTSMRVVATSRPAEDWPAVATLLKGAAAEALVEAPTIGPLPQPAVFELASRAIGPAFAGLVSEPLLRLTGGNPFYVLEVLRDVAERGQRLGPGEGVRLPATVRDAIVGRLGRAGEPARRLLAAAATCGRPSGGAELVAVADRAASAGDVEELVARRLLARLPDARLEFAHAFLREAVLDSLDADEARELHLGWARALEAAGDATLVERAGHVLASGEHDRGLFLAAAAQLERSWQHRAARPFYESVLARLPQDDPARGELFPRLERAAWTARDIERGAAICTEWAEWARAAGQPGVESRALALLAARLRDRADWPAARAAAQRAFEVGREAGDARAVTHARKVLAAVLCMAWDHAGALRHLEQALGEARQAGDARTTAMCLHDIALQVALDGRPVEGLEAIAEAGRLFGEVGDETWKLFVHSNEALILSYLGDLDGAAGVLRETIATARGQNIEGPLEFALENLAFTLLRAGRYPEALSVARDLFEQATRSASALQRVVALLASGEALFQLDQRDAARDHHRVAIELAEALGETRQLQFARLAVARDQRLDGRLEAARREARLAHEHAAATGNLRIRALAALELARLALEQADAALAVRWLADAEQALRIPREDGPAHRAMLLLERGRAHRLLGRPALALADVEEALGLARRGGPAEVEVQLLSLRAALADEAGQPTLAERSLADAAERIGAIAATIPDPEQRTRYLARPDRSGILEAARRRATAPGAAPIAHGALTSLYEVGRAVAEGGDLQPLLQRIVSLAVEAAGAEHGLLALRDEGTGELRPAASGLEQGTEDDALRVCHSVLEQAARGQAFLASDALADPALSQSASVAVLGIRSVMCVPLRIGAEVLGALYVDTRRATAYFAEADLRFLQALADQAAVALAYGRLVGRLSRERDALRQAAVATHSFGQLVGRAPAMRRVFELLEKVAPTDMPVIVQGESGTGKELVARALHFNSARRERAFLSENCAAIPESLLESILFGHARGAFTGADADRKGLFELADGGTLFLDEIGDMSAALQAKLLRVLQERELRPLGSDRSVRVDVRVLAATHRDLPALVAGGGFRQDLYFRLNGITIELPPLRARREDIPLLLEHLLARECRAAGRDVPEVDPVVLRALLAHDWPGNVRELENAARRLLLFTDGGRITAAAMAADPELAAMLGAAPARPARPTEAGATAGPLTSEALRRALEQAGGNRRHAAALLGISRATFYRRRKELGLE